MIDNLLLDSSYAKRQPNRPAQVSHDFKIYFNPPIRLDQSKPPKAALDQLTMSYSWYNLAAEYNNNKLKWRKDDKDAWKTLTFPDGQYSYENLEKFLQTATGWVDPDDKSKGYNLTLYFDFTIYRVVILMPKTYELDLTQGEFASLIGYKKKILKGAENFVGDVLPNITRGVDWVFVHTDLITRATNDLDDSSVLYYFSTAGLQSSFPFSKEPRRLAWQPVNKFEINMIHVWFTDGQNNLLNLNNLDVALSIKLEE